MNKELLTKPKHKKEAYQRRKQGQVIWRNTERLTEHAGRGDQWIFFYLNLSKALDSISHNILIGKLMKYGLNKCTVRCTEN